jgi:hypothetical protein
MIKTILYLVAFLFLSISLFCAHGLENKYKEINNNPNSEFTKGIALTGARHRNDLMKPILENIKEIRYAYNKRLRENPSLEGIITMKFKIDSEGNVFYSKLIESTLKDTILENTVGQYVSNLKFNRIDKTTDTTEVIYPFQFNSK